MKLLLVSNDRAAFAARMPLVQAARASGYDVEAVLPPGPKIPGLVTHDWRLDRRGLDPRAEWRSLRDLTRLYRRLRPDLVHHFTVKAIVFGGLAARRTRTPAVHTVTGLGYAFIPGGVRRAALRFAVQALLRRALARSRAVLFQNADDRDLFVRRRIVRPGQASVVPGSGVDLGRFQPLPAPPEPVTVAFIGRFLADKGVREFVDAARLARRQGAPTRWVLVGDVDAGNRATIAREEVAGWVREGVVEVRPWAADVRDALRQAHVVCLPSHREGVPRTLLEASACGRPAVATDVPGNRDAVVPGVTGLLVPLGDVPALADAVARLASDAALRAAMGTAGRRHVAERFGQDVVHARTLAAYAAALA